MLFRTGYITDDQSILFNRSNYIIGLQHYYYIKPSYSVLQKKMYFKVGLLPNEERKDSYSSSSSKVFECPICIERQEGKINRFAKSNATKEASKYATLIAEQKTSTQSKNYFDFYMLYYRIEFETVYYKLHDKYEKEYLISLYKKPYENINNQLCSYHIEHKKYYDLHKDQISQQKKARYEHKKQDQEYMNNLRQQAKANYQKKKLKNSLIKID
jgi:hypothetical protein